MIVHAAANPHLVEYWGSRCPVLDVSDKVDAYEKLEFEAYMANISS